jgi:hypothetical protein
MPRGAADARRVTGAPASTQRGPARARWGAAGWVTRTRTPAGTRTRLKAGTAQQGLRRGTLAREAHRAAGPRPWRAWVRPAGARAHLHLQRKTHGTKAGSQHKPRSSTAARPETARRRQGPLFPGLAGSLAISCQLRWITARVQRWGAPAPPPCFPCDQHQNGATAITRIQRRDARGAPGLNGAARRGYALPISSAGQPKAPALTGSSGAHGLG